MTCVNGHDAPFGVRCSVCNTDQRAPILIPCEGSGAPGHKVLSGFAATFAEECGGMVAWGPGMVMCKMCGSVVGDAGSGDAVVCAIGRVDDGTLRVCCSSHNATLCAHHYARTHFVETAEEWPKWYACNSHEADDS